MPVLKVICGLFIFFAKYIEKWRLKRISRYKLLDSYKLSNKMQWIVNRHFKMSLGTWTCKQTLMH